MPHPLKARPGGWKVLVPRLPVRPARVEDRLSTGNCMVAVNTRQTLTRPTVTLHEHRRARTLPAAVAVIARLGEPLAQTGVSS